MKRLKAAGFLGASLIFLTIMFRPALSSGSTDAFIRPSDSAVICSTIPGGSNHPGILRCGVKTIADGFVSNLEPDQVYGNLRGDTYGLLIVQATPSTPRQWNEAYVKFDLRGLSSYLGNSRSEPANASLWLYSRFLNAFQNATVRVHRVLSNNWDEATLTWKAKPPFASEFVSQQVRFVDTWYKWDVSTATKIAASNSSEISFALTPGGYSPQNYASFRSKDYGHFDQPVNITTAPELDLDFVEPLVTIITPFPNLSVNVDQTSFQTDETGRVETYLAWGSHQISLPESIPIDDSTRKALFAWSDGVQQATRTIIVGSNLNLTAEYRTQYKLKATSPYGLVAGSGWYFEGTTATVSLSATSVPAEGIVGYLGIRHVFDRWSGACTSTESRCSIVIDVPKSAVAQWREDFTVPLIAAVLVAIGLALTAFLRRPKRKDPGADTQGLRPITASTSA